MIQFNGQTYPASYRGEMINLPEGFEITRQIFNNDAFTQSSIEFPGEKFAEISAVDHFQKSDTLLIALGFEDGKIMLLETDFEEFFPMGDKYIREQHLAPISDFAFSATGKYLAIASFDGTVSVIEMDRYKSPSYLPMMFDIHNGWTLAVAFSNDEKHLIVGDQEGNLTFWNLDPSAYADQLCEDIRNQFNGSDYQSKQSESQTYFGTGIVLPQICN